MTRMRVDTFNPGSLKLMRGDTIVAFVVWEDRFDGTGWRVIPNAVGWPRSRKAWPTAYAAARSAFSRDTAKLFEGR